MRRSPSPETGGRLSGAAAENWSPLYRLRGGEDHGVLAPPGGFELVYSKETRYHGLTVVDDEDSRHLRFESSFQSGMYLDNSYRTRYRYTDYLQLPLAYAPGAEEHPLHRARRRLGAETDLARLPASTFRSWSSTRRCATWPFVTSTFRAARAWRSE